jgi:hypothetical protein
VVELSDDGRDLQIVTLESNEDGRLWLARGWRRGDGRRGRVGTHCRNADSMERRRWQHQGHKRRHRDEVIAIGPSGLRSAVELDPESRKFKMSCSALEAVLGKVLNSAALSGAGVVCSLSSSSELGISDREARGEPCSHLQTLQYKRD